MQFNNLDSIVRQWLLEKGLPVHYYLEGLVHGASCLRQLTIDTLKVINSANLPLNAYNSITLPNDFQDDLAVCIPVGNELQPVAKRNSLSPIRSHNATSGAFENPNAEVDANGDDISFLGINSSYFWFWNVNAWGEPTGAFYGANGGAANGYKVIKERREIQLTGTFTSDSVVLLYVSDGLSADNASQVDLKATDTIIAYINWKTSPNAAMKDSYEAATYYNEKRLLKGKLNDLTLTDLRQTLRENYTAAIKS